MRTKKTNKNGNTKKEKAYGAGGQELHILKRISIRQLRESKARTLQQPHLSELDKKCLLAEDIFIDRELHGGERDKRIIKNLLEDYNGYSCGQAILCYVWMAEDLRNQLMKQIGSAGREVQGQLFE